MGETREIDQNLLLECARSKSIRSRIINSFSVGLKPGEALTEAHLLKEYTWIIEDHNTHSGLNYRSIGEKSFNALGNYLHKRGLVSVGPEWAFLPLLTNDPFEEGHSKYHELAEITVKQGTNEVQRPVYTLGIHIDEEPFLVVADYIWIDRESGSGRTIQASEKHSLEEVVSYRSRGNKAILKRR